MHIKYTQQLFEGLLKTYNDMITETMVTDVDDTMMSLGEHYSSNLLWNDKDELNPAQVQEAHNLACEMVACIMLRLTQSSPEGG